MKKIPDLIEFQYPNKSSSSDDHSSFVDKEVEYDDEGLRGGTISLRESPSSLDGHTTSGNGGRRRRKKKSSKNQNRNDRKNKIQTTEHRNAVGCCSSSKFTQILLMLNLLVIALLCPTYVTLKWFHRVHDMYLVKLLNAAIWTKERQENEITYYKRECTIDDLTTTNPNDLILNDSKTDGATTSPAEVAYQHQLKHGFTVFPYVLSQSTATELREHILSRKYNLTKQESIYVINNENRFSYALDSYRIPAVLNAMNEITKPNSLLTKSITKILGFSPALIEMTAITTSYGAKDQWW